MRRLAGVLALALASCGGGADGEHGQERGQRLYVQLCVSCHGMAGAGGAIGPPLENLSEHWTREQIAEYLSNPRAWLERDERLQALKQRYSTEMPATSAPEADRLLLADRVLELSAAL